MTAELIQRARAKDRAAWRSLYAMHAPRVRRVCAAFAELSAADCEDVVQESFVRAFRSIDRLRDPEAFMPWLLQIARSICLQRLRQSGAESRRLSAWADDPSIGPTAPRGDLLQERAIEVVRELIDGLPEGPERETVRLFYLEGKMTAREIAERFGLGKSAVTMRLERFRARVKRRLMAKVARLEEAET